MIIYIHIYICESLYTLYYIIYYIYILCIYIYYVYIYTYIIWGCVKFGYGSAGSDPDVWIGLDHLRFGMDRGYGSACGLRVWIRALHFDS